MATKQEVRANSKQLAIGLYSYQCPIPKILSILLINRATIENRAAN